MRSDEHAKSQPKSFEQLTTSAAGRFEAVERPYLPEDVLRLRGSLQVRHTFAERGSNRLWELLRCEPYIPCLGAMTGNQAMQMVRAGLKAIYLSGWQVAADANTAGQVYPDQSLSRQTPALNFVAASTKRWPAPTRSSTPKAAPSATGLRRSLPMPRPVLADRSMPSKS